MLPRMRQIGTVGTACQSRSGFHAAPLTQAVPPLFGRPIDYLLLPTGHSSGKLESRAPHVERRNPLRGRPRAGSREKQGAMLRPENTIQTLPPPPSTPIPPPPIPAR